MRRSEINYAISKAKKILKKNNIALPFFGYMNLEDWSQSNIDFTQLKETMLGWDITDFGSDDFKHVGATLFTIRNGNVYNEHIGTPYAEKYIILEAESKQEIPMHFHIKKTEDIINRAGGNLMIQVYNCETNGGLDKKNDVVLFQDGVRTVLKAGETIKVTTGNSVTLTPLIYHRFYADDADVVIGEVSSINDDNKDNIFLNSSERFSMIIEDEPILHILVNEYDKIIRKGLL